MKFGIVRFPGSNCDRDCRRAVEEGAGAEAVFLWHKSHDLAGSDVILLPGGFSYGDYLRAGAIARFSPIMREVIDFARSGGAVLGICNGFQILCEANLLPGALTRNRGLRFRSHDTRVRVEAETPFTSGYRRGRVLRMPLSHGEGRYFADEETVRRLEAEDRVVLRYVDAGGEPTPSANPNGSVANIAGICDDGRRVVGIMPHPDRAFHEILGSEDGAGFFRSPVAAALEAPGRASAG